jgi:ABC-type transport system involved in multi-copper enzyme maturation permease subunit
MKELSSMIWIETRKALRSRMPLFTSVWSLVMPLGIAFLILLATNPEISRQLGLLGAKANLVAYASTSWPSYFGLLAQIVAAGVFLISCLIISWVFGREFVDRTVKDMLAVPVQRSSILLAKFIVTATWSAVLAVLTLITGLVTGALLGLPEGSPAVLLHGGIVMMITSCLVTVVVLPFALFASVGRGYLLPIGVAILTLILANLAAVIGLAPYFPWAIPGLYSQGQGTLVPISYPIVMLTGVAGMAGTYLWWKYADQSL